MQKERLQKYAELIVKCGLNVHQGQEVNITCGLDQPEFVAMVTEECYKAGASKVNIDWTYMPIAKLNYIYQDLETLSEVTDIAKAKLQRNVDKISCKLWIDSDDPDGLNGVDNEKVAKACMAQYPIIKPYRDAIENKYQWCIVGVPGVEWARKVFPNMNDNDAIEALWEAILTTARVDEDPIEAWRVHNANLAKRCQLLNDYHFDSLEYKSANGTDFKVGLIEQGKFSGGGENTVGSGIYFNPNIPSEEVFTSPVRGKAEGLVVATKPLSYQGKLIENFSIRFENGKAVEVHAEKNQDSLEKMIAMDEGAAYLGECALIAYDSPINNTGLLFFNTLYDENASCHLALGRGFNDCIQGYETKTNEECKALGINESMIHVDFMIGSEDMNIVGVTKDGKRVQIFENGNWTKEFN